MRPLIGITTASITNPQGLQYNRMYAPIPQAVAKAGGLPVLIPTHLDEPTLRGLYERLDGLLLPGGPDVDPAQYGAVEKHPTVNIDAPRDAIELPLAQWAFADDLPIFGICRGHQLLNVALGGTLVQDIPSQWDTTYTHDLPDEEPRSTRLHEVTVDPASRLAAILGDTRVQVNSLHHQAVAQAAPAACVTAHAPDGIIEALEVPEKPFVLSVQWHPEDLYDEDPAMQRLFGAFVDASRERAAGR